MPLSLLLGDGNDAQGLRWSPSTTQIAGYRIGRGQSAGRIAAIVKHHNIDRKELKGWLFLSAPGGKAGKLMTVDQNGRFIRYHL
jgi:hypothetical protein